MTDPRDKHKHKHDKKHNKEQGKHAHVNKYADLIGKTGGGTAPVIDVIKQKNLKKEFTPHLDKPTSAKMEYTREEAKKHKNDPQRKQGKG